MTAPTSYCLWNSNTTEAFARAMRQRVTVRIKCCLPREGKPTDIVMHGRLRNVEGREVLFVPRHAEVQQGKSKAEENTCEFFFSLEQREESGISRMGYQGPGMVRWKRSRMKKATCAACGCALPAVAQCGRCAAIKGFRGMKTAAAWPASRRWTIPPPRGRN